MPACHCGMASIDRNSVSPTLPESYTEANEKSSITRAEVMQNVGADVTRILADIEHGDPAAAEQLLPLVYDELRRLAAMKMASERPDLTVQATALVHEAYIRLVDTATPQHWNGRGHFFAAAAEAMRRILVESARRRSAQKRGGDRQRMPLEAVDVGHPNAAEQLLALDAALSRFAQRDPVKAKLVSLRYFGGLTIEEAAKALGVSTATANRHWSYARAWLQTEIGDDAGAVAR